MAVGAIPPGRGPDFQHLTSEGIGEKWGPPDSENTAGGLGEGVLGICFHEVHESRVSRQIAYVGIHSFREINYGFVGFLEEPGMPPLPCVTLREKREERKEQQGISVIRNSGTCGDRWELGVPGHGEEHGGKV